MRSKNTLIIAEAGVNHNGSISTAKELIDVAAAANADYIKFQTFRSEDLVTEIAKKADYQMKNSNTIETQFQMLKKLELTHDNHFELIEYSRKKRIGFLSTAFDIKSIDFLIGLKLPFFKVPSGEITNLPYLRHLAKYKKKIIISTGMATLSEVKDALSVFLHYGLSKKDITVLHCNSEYPTPKKDVNLNAMLSIKNELGVKVGYSDHTLGIEVAIAAVAMGAEVIEKHITIDKRLNGPDHASSIEPKELISLVKSIRNVETSLGSKVKKPSQSEEKNIFVARKSIVAKKKINKGEKFSNENLTVKRPGSGISPMKWDSVIGKVSNFNFDEDDLINL